MNPDAIREVLALHVAGHPAESISFGATVTIVCGNEVTAARWRSRTPDGVLPDSGVPVQVVCVDSEGVGTGADEGATGQDTGTAWVTRSADCPKAPAQAHPLGPDGFTCLAGDVAYDRLHGVDGYTQTDAPVSRVEAIEAAEDHADQTAFDAARERGTVSARDLSDDELVAELQRRGSMPRCRCGRWQTYIGAYDADGKTLRCAGCLKAIAKCWCR